MSKPSDFHPGLTDERLAIVAKIITDARHECAIRHEAKMGDNNWTTGSRAYEWSCYGVVRGSMKHPWLTIVEGGNSIETATGTEAFRTGLKFVFAVGGMPLRFYKGEPSDVPKRSLRVTYPELAARQVAMTFGESTAPTPHALRLAVEVDEDGEVSRITLVQVMDEDATHIGETWVITQTPVPANVAQFTPKKEEGKDLGEPIVGSRKKQPEEEGDGRDE